MIRILFFLAGWVLALAPAMAWGQSTSVAGTLTVGPPRKEGQIKVDVLLSTPGPTKKLIASVPARAEIAEGATADDKAAAISQALNQAIQGGPLDGKIKIQAAANTVVVAAQEGSGIGKIRVDAYNDTTAERTEAGSNEAEPQPGEGGGGVTAPRLRPEVVLELVGEASGFAPDGSPSWLTWSVHGQEVTVPLQPRQSAGAVAREVARAWLASHGPARLGASWVAVAGDDPVTLECTDTVLAVGFHHR